MAVSRSRCHRGHPTEIVIHMHTQMQGKNAEAYADMVSYIHMIDIFDKFMHVAAIKGKKEEDLASGMIVCLQKIVQTTRLH